MVRTKYKEPYSVYKWGSCLKWNLLPGDVTATGRIILGVPLYIERKYFKCLYYIILWHTSMHIDSYLYLPINWKPPRRCLCGGEKNYHIWRERKLEGKWGTCNKKLLPSSEKAASLVLRSLVSAQRLALNKAQVTKQSHFKCHWIYLRSNYHL